MGLGRGPARFNRPGERVELRVRDAQPEDLAAVAALHRRVVGELSRLMPSGLGQPLRMGASKVHYLSIYEEALEDPDQLLLVAEVSMPLGKVGRVSERAFAGYLLARLVREAESDLLDPPYLEAQFLAVEQGFRGMGVAERLIEELEHRAAAQGMRAILLSVFECNRFARGLYRRMGFETVERLMVKLIGE